jgi:hypothetical protein
MQARPHPARQMLGWAPWQGLAARLQRSWQPKLRTAKENRSGFPSQEECLLSTNPMESSYAGKAVAGWTKTRRAQGSKTFSAGPRILTAPGTTARCLWVYLGGLRLENMRTVAGNPSELGDACYATSRAVACHILHPHIKRLSP